MPRSDGTSFIPGLPADATAEQRRERIKELTPQERALLAKNLTPSVTTTLARWVESHAAMPSGVRDRIQLAIDFFRQRFARKSDSDILSELVCMDFHRPVRVIPLGQGATLVGYKTPGSPDVGGSYFTYVGQGPQNLGISLTGDHDGGPQMDKEHRRYRVVKTVPFALESYAAPASDRWSLGGRRVLASGGGKQLCIPDAASHLELVRAGERELSAQRASLAFLKRG